jgi:hypothetical protein
MKLNRNLILPIQCLKVDKTKIDFNELNKLFKKEIPFIISDCNIIKDPNASNSDLIKLLLNKNIYKVSASLDKTFSGMANEHSQIEMDVQEYLDYKGNINLYLSQINLLENKNLKNCLNYNKLTEIR